MKEKIEELLNNCHKKKKMIVKQIKEIEMCATDVTSPECYFLSRKNTLEIQLLEQKLKDLNEFITDLNSIV